MSALEAIRIASWCRRSGSKRVDVSSSAAICSASRALIASAFRPGAASARAVERGDLVEPRAQHAAERVPFAPAHLGKACERGARSRRSTAASPARRSSSRSSSSMHLDHALEREDAVDRGRRGLDALGDIARWWTSTAASTGSFTRTTGATPARCTVRLACMVPRASVSAARARSGASTASQPGGSAQRAARGPWR